MGIETAMIVMAAVSAGASVAKIGFDVKAAESAENALNLQAKQATIQYQQKTLSNLDTMEKTLDAQAAALTTRGVAFSSPSFNAIQRATLNIGAKRGRNIETEESLAQENIRIEKENVRSHLWASIFGDVSQAAMSAASIAAKMPTTQKLPQMET